MSAERLSDRAARERIACDLESNLCVEAGAGTGKTTVLVERVVNLLASGRVGVDELVVITFTEKAAAELSTRVRDVLEQRAREADDEERERLLRAARELYRARVETIHSFAAALLRERPVEAGIDPLFEVLDELGARLEFDRAYERFQDQLFSQPREELELALRRGFGLAELREACEHLHAHRYLLPLRHPEPRVVGHEGIVEELTIIADALAALLVKHEPGEDKAVPLVEGIVDWMGALRALEPLAQERRLLFRRAPKTDSRLGVNSAWGGEKEHLKQLQTEFKELVENGKAALRTEALLAVLPHVEAFVEQHTRARKDAGLADFDDLLFWARDLLRDSKPARAYFRRRYRAVLIDEFQDTDPVQAELALLLTSDENPGEDWRNLRPAPGRLTVVGDPKQSIYRFRRADTTVYDQIKNHALAEGQERISTNFRSNPELIVAFNAAFDEILQEMPGVQPANVRLHSPPAGQPSRRTPIVIADGSAQGSADVIREEEARVTAALLYTAREERWEVRDRREGDRWRSCRWGDMAILLPARTGLELFEDALAQAGIPYRHEGSRDFFKRDEVRDLIWLLSAIDDPTDRVALLGALRSSAFAISDEQLVIHTAAAGAFFRQSSNGGPTDIVDEALAQLSDLRRMRRGLSLAETVRRVVEGTRLVEFALTRRDAEQGAANLLAIVDDARLFSAAGGGGLRPFIRHLRDSMDQEAIEIEATVAEETDDVVRIMTMHGAKGLEYPIVSLANMGSERTAHRAPVAREHESFLHFRVGAKSTSRFHFSTPGFDEVWESEKEYIDAERLRLLYVAATRARDHLLVPCVVGRGKAGHLLGALVNALPNDEALVGVLDASKLEAPAAETRDSAGATEREVEATVGERVAWIAERVELRRSAGHEREIETASSRERARGPLAAEVATFAGALVVGEGPPIPVGDAVHMVMERISLPDGEDLEAIVEDVCLEGDIAEHMQDVAAMCKACLSAGSVQQALAGGRYWREVPFVLSRAKGSEDPQASALATGRVDLVYEDDGQLVVVDYKTDRDVTAHRAEEHALEHHSGQAELYAQALSAASGWSVGAVVFVYCKAGVEVRLSEGAVVR